MLLPFVLALGFGAALLLSSSSESDEDAHDAGAAGGAYNDAGGAAYLASLLTCDQAIAALGDAGTTVAAALASSTDAPALDALALAVERGASDPGLDAMARAARLRAATCVRDRAAVVRLASLGGGGGGGSSEGLRISHTAEFKAEMASNRELSFTYDPMYAAQVAQLSGVT